MNSFTLAWEGHVCVLEKPPGLQPKEGAWNLPLLFNNCLNLDKYFSWCNSQFSHLKNEMDWTRYSLKFAPMHECSLVASQPKSVISLGRCSHLPRCVSDKPPHGRSYIRMRGACSVALGHPHAGYYGASTYKLGDILSPASWVLESTKRRPWWLEVTAEPRTDFSPFSHLILPGHRRFLHCHFLTFPVKNT